MLPQSRRLPRPDFLRAKELGRKFHFSNFSLTVYHQSPTRYAVVIPTSISKSSVIRNRLRRLIYSSLPPTTPYHAAIIIYPRPSMLNLSRDQISLELNQAISGLTI